MQLLTQSTRQVHGLGQHPRLCQIALGFRGKGADHVLFRRKHAGQGCLHPFFSERLPLLGVCNAFILHLQTGGSVVLDFLQIGNQSPCHQHATQQQPAKHYGNLGCYRPVAQQATLGRRLR